MKIQYSPIIAGASGSMGGMTASRNRYGAYLRARVVPVNPNTQKQALVRSAFALALARWRGNDAGNIMIISRQRWAEYAAAVPVLKGGLSQYVSGLNAYMASAVIRELMGCSTSYQFAPLELVGPETDTVVASELKVEADGSNPSVSIAFDNTLPWAKEAPVAGERGGALLIYASSPQPSSVNYFNGPFRYAQKVDGVATTGAVSPVVLTSLPFVIMPGEKVFFKFRIIRADNRLSQFFGQQSLEASLDPGV